MGRFRIILCLSLFVGLASGHEYLNKVSGEVDSSEAGQQEGSKSTTCPCGWTNKARIVGGTETHVNEFPFMVGIVLAANNFMFCGGTIISKRHVITAAHCTQPTRGRQIAVVIGEHDKTTQSETNATQVIKVAAILEHEEYNIPKGTTKNDIAILVLEREIQFNQKVGPVCMPTERQNLVNEYIKVIGWGKLWTNGPSSNKLMKVNLRVIPLEICAKLYSRPLIRDFVSLTNPTQICTFSKNKDSCQGDSGGPLVYLDPQTNRYTLVGLVSYGRACASADPAVSTDVAAFLPWITKSLQGLKTCTKA